MFTGDRSGDWLFAAMHAGRLRQPADLDAIATTASRCAMRSSAPICRCAPPANKPLPEEIAACRPYLVEEIGGSTGLRVVVALGQIALNGFLRRLGRQRPHGAAPRPRFGHGARSRLDDRTWLVTSYHPSQQNTFTGRLTRPMLEEVFRTARRADRASRRRRRWTSQRRSWQGPAPPRRVGASRFERPTTRTPSECATRLRHAPDS